MIEQFQTESTKTPPSSLTSVTKGVLPRKHMNSKAADRPLTADTSGLSSPRRGHDFSRIHVYSEGQLAGESLPHSFASGANNGFPPVQAKPAVAPPHDMSEQIADNVAQRAVHQQAGANLPGLTSLPKRPSSSPANPHLSEMRVDSGKPLSASTRHFAEPVFGQDLSRVRLHTGEADRMIASRLGARAFTQGHDIWLGPNESESDKFLLAHELTHVVQQTPGMIYLRRATYLERRAWLSFFSHYMPRLLLNNYMDDTGAEIRLTPQQMRDCNPIVDIRRSEGFRNELARLRSAGGGTSTINVSGWGGALTNGTLGNFTINYHGTVTVSATGDWSFTGTMDFYDFWDFDPKPFGSGSGRPIPAEIKVRVAAIGIPGRPFHVRSEQAPVTQTSADTRATWGGGTPTPAPDVAARAGADIEVGEATGSVGGAPGVEVGAEAGAQEAEDLNR